jgi:hypothetical protein
MTAETAQSHKLQFFLLKTTKHISNKFNILTRITKNSFPIEKYAALSSPQLGNEKTKGYPAIHFHGTENGF